MPAKPRRGEVWWVQLDPTRGAEIQKTRPCVVVTANVVNERRRTVVVVPLSSSQIESPPLLVGVGLAQTRSVAVIDQIRAVSKERLHRRLGSVSAEELDAIESGLRDILEL